MRLYEKIVALRPDWHSDDPTQGKIKVVMTGSAADPAEFQPHLHSKDVRKDLKARAKNPDDPLELVIVRDMWLTGFDAPSMHTMYVDKTMQGAGLMQAIARVNRTFRDKPGGLIVDYIGVFSNLQKALVEYSPSDRDQAGVPIEEIVAAMLEKHDIIRGLLHGCDLRLQPRPARRRSAWLSTPRCSTSSWPTPTAPSASSTRCWRSPRRTPWLAPATRRRPSATTPGCSPTYAPPSSRSRTRTPVAAESARVEIDTAIGQLVNEAVAADEVVDIYKLAGIETPELSILSATSSSTRWPTRTSPTCRWVCFAACSTTRSGRCSAPTSSRPASSPSCSKRRSTGTPTASLTTAEIIAELVKLAKEMRDQAKRHEQLGLTVAEAAFYDAIVQNDAAVLQMGDDTLKKMAAELVESIRQSATIDWNLKESVRATMRTKVRRLLAKYDYPPDLEEKAVELVLEQAELFAGQRTQP